MRTAASPRWAPWSAASSSATDFAITGSVSYDDTKTHDKQFQDQNRNQWLITNTATVGSYVGSPIASTNSVLPGGKTYIDPQLAYFSDILDQIETKGATLGAEWKWSENITSTFNWFFIDEEEDEHHLLQQGVVLRRQRRDQSAPAHRLRSRASIRRSPTRSTATGSFNRPP